MERNSFLKGTLLGILAGAAAGLLFAPKSGEETRADIRNTYNEMKDKVLDEISKAKDFSKEMYDKAVANTISTYKEAKKITPKDAEKIKAIFDDSFTKIEKIIKEDVKEVKKSVKETNSKINNK